MQKVMVLVVAAAALATVVSGNAVRADPPGTTVKTTGGEVFDIY